MKSISTYSAVALTLSLSLSGLTAACGSAPDNALDPAGDYDANQSALDVSPNDLDEESSDDLDEVELGELTSDEVNIDPTCFEDARRELQKGVDKLCKTPAIKLACTNDMVCQQVKSTILRIKKCIKARNAVQKWYDRCKPGQPDPGDHKKEVRDRRNAIKKCQERAKVVCR